MRLRHPLLVAMIAAFSLPAYAAPPNKPSYRVSSDQTLGLPSTVPSYVPMWIDPSDTSASPDGQPTAVSSASPMPVAPTVTHSAPTGATVLIGTVPITIIPGNLNYVGWSFKTQGSPAPGQIACGSWTTAMPSIGTLNGAQYCAAGFPLAPTDPVTSQDVGQGALFVTPFTAVASAPNVFAISYQVQLPLTTHPITIGGIPVTIGGVPVTITY